MKKIIIAALLLSATELTTAQTFDEWFNQKATQKKYLFQQIAALQVYTGYVSKGYSIAKQGLKTIDDFKRGDFKLHDNYFYSLVSVNPNVKRYAKVADIISLQIDIAKHTAKTIKDCKKSKQLSISELEYLQQVFNKVMEECANCLDALFNIITNGRLSMKDDERINAIDKLYDEMSDRQIFSTSFSNSAKALCLQREKDHHEIIISKKLNELK